MRTLLLPLLLGAAAPPPESVWLCERTSAPVSADGRAFGHYRYAQANPDDLVAAPAAFGGGCLVQRAMLPDLERLAAAVAGDPAVAGRLRAISCYRTVAYQQSVFCRGLAANPDQTTAQRAWSSAPPGHSEHATGYVLDFGVRGEKCNDLDNCLTLTVAGRWLLANAPRYGFEMSFPVGNTQGVGWEPWHWRWVGRPGDPAGLTARRLFARARAFHPGLPQQGEPVTRIAFAQPAPAPVAAAPPRPETKKERRAREKRERAERRAREKAVRQAR
jgi:D-alanyl-D-alanine carboxypeptidase